MHISPLTRPGIISRASTVGETSSLSKSQVQNAESSILVAPTNQQSPSTWEAHPNTTISPNASFDTVTLAIPASGQGPVALISGSPAANQTTPSMFLYGQTAAVDSSGQLEMLFYAVATQAPGVWELQWDVANPNDANVVAVAVRIVPPSNPSNQPDPSN
jgi:hypothetical protein